MRRKGKLLIAVIVLFLAGLILLAIAVSEISQSTSLLNTTVDLEAVKPQSSYGVSASHYLNGYSNGSMKGSLQSAQCCVYFYIFVASSWNNWEASNFTITNSSNSPAFVLNSSEIDSKSGASFTFVPDPSAIYMLTFFNANRSLWNRNSNVLYQIKADISFNYSAAPDKFLVYPAVALMVIGVVLIFVRTKLER